MSYGSKRAAVPISRRVGRCEVRVIGERSEQRARVKPFHQNDIDLRTQHQRRRHEEKEGEQTQHQRGSEAP